MVRTQIQLPDDVIRRAKRLAEARAISMAKLVRNGLELILRQYPDPDSVSRQWSLPEPIRLGWRGLSDAQVKEQAQLAGLGFERVTNPLA